MRTQATKRASSPQAEPSVSHHRLREGILIIISAVSLFLFLSLITYHHTDPGWSRTGVSEGIINGGGRLGAILADVSFYIFGLVSYLFPLILIYLSILLFKERQSGGKDIALLVIRCVGFLLILGGACGLASLETFGIIESLPYSMGGVIGMEIDVTLINIFGLLGTTLILLSLLLSGVTLLTGLSWVRIFRQLMRQCVPVIRSINHSIGQLKPLIKKTAEAYKTWSSEKRLVKNLPPSVGPLSPLPHQSPRKMGSMKPPLIKPKELSQMVDIQSPVFAHDVDGDTPSLSLLDTSEGDPKRGYDTEQLEQLSQNVEMRLKDFGIDASVVAIQPGPVVTRFELQLAPGIKVSKISGLSKDLARSLSMPSVRIVDVIPGKSVVGLELPNHTRAMVRLSDVLASPIYQQSQSPLSLALGQDISGVPVVVDLIKMPHLLVAGTTGSGKSVGINAMLLSMLYKSDPSEIRFILIDPKMLELSVYEKIPHLLSPVVTDMKEAANALRWCVVEMERRYRLMAKVGVRNLAGYNKAVQNARDKKKPLTDPFWQPMEGEAPPELNTLPYIVVVIDEFADMMMVVGKKVEQLIARIAQKARAAGIHLILATQRPSVDVITGLIKSNIPTRIAFQVSSKIDSRTIIDQGGAEQLLGHGDMLYLAPGGGTPIRIHGAFVDDHEIKKVTDDWRTRGEPVYIKDIVEEANDNALGNSYGGGQDQGELDEYYDHAVRFVTQKRRASISSVQRQFKIGYNRAARLIEDMERAGVVSPMESNGSREVLAPAPISD